jgi:hypothetical protein
LHSGLQIRVDQQKVISFFCRKANICLKLLAQIDGYFAIVRSWTELQGINSFKDVFFDKEISAPLCSAPIVDQTKC